MLILQHETDGEILVLADDAGLEGPMVRDVAGTWKEAMVTVPDIMENYLEVRDEQARADLLQQAKDAYNELHNRTPDSTIDRDEPAPLAKLLSLLKRLFTGERQSSKSSKTPVGSGH